VHRIWRNSNNNDALTTSVEIPKTGKIRIDFIIRIAVVVWVPITIIIPIPTIILISCLNACRYYINCHTTGGDLWFFFLVNTRRPPGDLSVLNNIISYRAYVVSNIIYCLELLLGMGSHHSDIRTQCPADLPFFVYHNILKQ